MKKNGILSRAFLVLLFLFLYAPIFVLIVFSFNDSKSNAVWGGFTLDWYTQLFNNRTVLDALQTTLLVSVLATLIATVAGTAAAIGFSRMRRRSRTVCMTVNNIPLTNPDIITGVSMMLLFVFAGQALAAFSGWLNGLAWVENANLWFDFGFNLGFITLLIAHVTFDIPYVILSVLPKIRQLDPNLAEAALDLGATPMTAFRKVVLPELMPGIINGALIAFTMSIDDFVISYFHCRQPGVHPLHGGLLHGAPPGQPGDQRIVHTDVRGGAGADGRHQSASGSPGGRPAAGAPCRIAGMIFSPFVHLISVW